MLHNGGRRIPLSPPLETKQAPASTYGLRGLSNCRGFVAVVAESVADCHRNPATETLLPNPDRCAASATDRQTAPITIDGPTGQAGEVRHGLNQLVRARWRDADVSLPLDD